VNDPKLLRRFLIVLALGMALYLSLAVWSGWDSLTAALAKMPPSSLAAVLGLVLLGLGLRALRWHFFVVDLRWPVPIGPSVKLFFASFAFTATPGKAGEAVKSGYLKRDYGVPVSDSVGVLLVERIYDLLAVLLLAIGGIGLLPNATLYVAVSAGAVVGIGLFAGLPFLHRPVLTLMAKIAKLKPLVAKIDAMLVACRRLLRPVIFGPTLVLSLISWACEGVAFWMILQGVGADTPLLSACSIYGLATIAGALSMLPGGIGGMEAVMLVLLHRSGVDQPAAVAATVLLRACTLWFASALGFAFLAWVSRSASHADAGRRPV
jgi:uncharacterized protein (TIRG00374 family)